MAKVKATVHGAVSIVSAIASKKGRIIFIYRLDSHASVSVTQAICQDVHWSWQ